MGARVPSCDCSGSGSGSQAVKSPALAKASFVLEPGKGRLPGLDVSLLLEFVTQLHFFFSFKSPHSLLTLLLKAVVSIVNWGLRQISALCFR